MWIPRSAADVEEAAARGGLEETHTFDAKVDLPTPKKNHDLAVDVDAMTVDGGSLLYGLGEDENGQLTALSPIELAGAPERIAQIVETSISEPPFIRVQTLPLDGDGSKGYVLVVIPQSPRAPHQVISGGDMRYYGRGAKGNRVLSEAEVAAVYARRERWEVDREALLRDELFRAPEANPELGYLLAFARPVVPDDSMVERVAGSGNEILELLMKGAGAWGDVRADRYGQRYDPDFRGAVHSWRRGAAGWAISTYPESDDAPVYTAKLDLDFDGTGHFFCGRVVDTISSGSPGAGSRVVFETILAGNLASFFAAMGALYEAAGYVGHVDVGMAVTGIEGALSTANRARHRRRVERRPEGNHAVTPPAIPGRNARHLLHTVRGADGVDASLPASSPSSHVASGDRERPGHESHLVCALTSSAPVRQARTVCSASHRSLFSVTPQLLQLRA